ncbi:MAG: replicative DNA helicase [Candidatus Binatia bacterium]|nr:replicative DNA helicase [Candidatus Binatia bacterium]
MNAIQEIQEHSLYSASAERAVLGSILLSEGKKFATVAADLIADDFFLENHRMLFRIMANLDADGKPIDLVTVGQKLIDTSQFQAIDLSRLTDGLPNFENISHYIEMVKHKRDFRRIAAVSQNTTARMNEGEDTPEELAAHVAKEMGEIVTASRRGGLVSLGEALRGSCDSIESLGMGRHGIGLPTGLRALDGLLGGLKKSEMIVIAARPSVGKTALAVNIGVRAAQNGSSVVLFSLEMGKDAISQRILCAEARVNSWKASQGFASREEKSRLMHAAANLASLPFYIDDEIQRVETIAARAKAFQQQHGLDLLIVDYLQLIIGGRQENRTQEVSYISRSIKGMAKSLNIPVLAISQLSRQTDEGEPKLSDLRESGQIEQDADVVAFLWRDAAGKAHSSRNEFLPEDNTVNLTVAKHRNGPTGKIKLAFLKDICKFEDQQHD